MAMTTKTPLLWIGFSMYLGQYVKFVPLRSSHRLVRLRRVPSTPLQTFLQDPLYLPKKAEVAFKTLAPQISCTCLCRELLCTGSLCCLI